ncbi:MAG TPA: RidA family protein [Hyphomicrobiaceae bacterium]|nr:RidA family protein [Hyphomicrobiaceae bacterium]
MPRKLISSGSRFEAEVGYSRAVVDGDMIFVSGTTGYDYKAMSIAPEVEAQCVQTFENIKAALALAESSLDDVVRATFILPDRADWPKCWPIVSRYFGKVRPASTMIVAGLAEPEMRIEIEVTAKRSRG